MNTTEIVCDTPCLDLILSVIACRIRSIETKERINQMFIIELLEDILPSDTSTLLVVALATALLICIPVALLG